MESNFYENAATPHSLGITPPSASYLREIAKWGKFLAVVGYVMIGTIVLGAVFAGFMMSSALSESIGGTFVGGFFALFYVLIALLYFFPVLYLHRFSGKMQEALQLQDEELLTASFGNLKSLFKFMGILTIVVLGFYALGLLSMFLGVGIGAMM
ncbi:DUF5362 family protein [Pontibacter litorisediminis]|uniref:DUF5362 family protein n=1 Tax=Pontibacter litorisediminis TaxID=1846260 RepID=UPI0023EDC64A|nr:DUF5362 family protein [Pontibacter litorisediminis]